MRLKKGPYRGDLAQAICDVMGCSEGGKMNRVVDVFPLRFRATPSAGIQKG